MTTLMRIYKTLFSLSDAEVEQVIKGVQETARQYSAEYTNPPLPFTDPALDDKINELLQLDPAISLSDAKREAFMKMLVEYHDLKILNPWDPDGGVSIMAW